VPEGEVTLNEGRADEDTSQTDGLSSGCEYPEKKPQIPPLRFAPGTH
jgi:hypothetical protein